MLIYYGKKDRATAASDMAKYDVVLTTYPVVEIEWRGEENKTKVKCKYCSKLFAEKKLRDHNKYWCGPNAKRTSKQRKTDKKSEDAAAAATVQSVNLGGQEFLDVAAPDASLSQALQKRNSRGTNKKKTETPAEDEAFSPSGVTDIYRDIMKKGGRQAIGMYERINGARGRNQTAFADGDTNHDDEDDKDEVEEEDAEEESDGEASHDDGNGEVLSVELLLTAVGDVAKCGIISAQGKASTGWYPAKVVAVDAKKKTVKVHYVGWSAKYDEVILLSAKRLKRAAEEAAAVVAVKKEKQPKGKQPVKKTAGTKGRVAVKLEKQQVGEVKVELVIAKAEPAKPKPNAAAKSKKKKRKSGDSEDEEWSPTVKDEEEGQSARGRKRKAVSYVESESSGDESEEDSHPRRAAAGKKQKRGVKKKTKKKKKKLGGSDDDDFSEGSGDEGDDDDDDDGELICMPTTVDGAALPVEWDGLDLSESKLHSVVWKRVVLDEAHKIKGRTTNVAKAIYSLRAEYRWCLSGTPLQNNVGELYGLVKFLKMDPWAYYCCSQKGCECKFMNWQFQRGAKHRNCDSCGHRSFFHFSYFNKHIIRPISTNGFSGTGRDAMVRIRNDVLHKIQLRRTKALVAKDINLPPLTIKVVTLALSEDEKDFYEAIYKQSKLKFDSFGAKGTVLNNYAHIFDMLGRLRQACDHPYLIVHGANRKAGDKAIASRTTRRPEKAGALCGLCQDLVSEADAAVAGCKHVFHSSCISDYVHGIDACEEGTSAAAASTGKKKQQQPGCPVCFKALTITLTDPSEKKTEAQIKKDAAKAASESGEGSATKTKKKPAGKAAEKAGGKRKAAEVVLEEGEEEEEEEEDEEAELQRALLMSLEGPVAAGDDDGDSEDNNNTAAAYAKGGPSRAASSAAASAAAAAPAPAPGLLTVGAKIGRGNFLHGIDMDEFVSSSKLDALVSALQAVRKKSPDHKSIIFSQYTNFLDIVEWRKLWFLFVT